MVEVDLTKPKLNFVWVGTEDDSSPLKGYTQKLEYESVPKFCKHCRILGHSIAQCRKMEKQINEEKRDTSGSSKSTGNRINVVQSMMKKTKTLGLLKRIGLWWMKILLQQKEKSLNQDHKDMVDNIDDEVIKHNGFAEERMQDSDAQVHMEEMCDTVGIYPTKRGRRRQRKGSKASRKNRNNCTFWF
ncbi:hypothetical protein HAX54_005067 [Datura stramonium]|uniref:Uncharacterized protein n=1 Tax=Datura stramonium TaxID=4076 RepID=A0ABS8T826_DATST|nr:hypothetical protein [Datura stramonium]